MRASGVASMNEQDRQISAIVAEQRLRLRAFIRRRVPAAEVEDLLQDVFTELVEANRLLMPIDHLTGWLFRVARNRITDFFRKQKPEALRDTVIDDETGDMLALDELLPSPELGPEADYFRTVLLEEFGAALAELPEDQRSVFLAHEFEGWTFREIADRTGTNINTLLARKRYAVLHLRERLQEIYHELLKK
jgi:RNA polymerase sigma factor (sigma-70 family)